MNGNTQRNEGNEGERSGTLRFDGRREATRPTGLRSVRERGFVDVGVRVRSESSRGSRPAGRPTRRTIPYRPVFSVRLRFLCFSV